MIRLLDHNARPTRRVALHLGGLFDEWTRIEVTRDLGDISGSFQLELRDAARSGSAWPFATARAMRAAILAGEPARITIDGEPVLVGNAEEVSPQAAEGQVSVSITGRDRTGDLVDCAAAPFGPSEFKNIKLDEFARRVTQPFGVKVRVEVDVGDAIPRAAIDAGETGISTLEKYARRKGVLLASDGVGGLALTRSGRTRAPGDLSLPGNILESSGTFSQRGRFSDYIVKGQAEQAQGTRAKKAPLDSRAAPLGAANAPKPEATREDSGVAIQGRARDAEIRRYRPFVSMARTQTTAKDAQTQAEWQMRNRRGQGESLDYLVHDYRENGGLWRPNALVFVDDAYQLVYRDMLIAGVSFLYDERGETTRLRITGPEAYDMEPEGDRRRNRSRGKRMDSTARPL